MITKGYNQHMITIREIPNLYKSFKSRYQVVSRIPIINYSDKFGYWAKEWDNPRYGTELQFIGIFAKKFSITKYLKYQLAYFVQWICFILGICVIKSSHWDFLNFI